MSTIPEEGIDLRSYVRIVAQRRRIVGGVVAFALLAALAVQLIMPKTYEARAIVVVMKPLYTPNFDSRFLPASPQDALVTGSGLVPLATSDSLLNSLFSARSSSLPSDVKTVEDLRRLLTAEPTSEPSMIALVVRAPDPQQSAALANAWADLLVKQAGAIYGRGHGDLTYVESQRDAAASDLTKAQATLADFEAHNQLNLLQSQLQAQQGYQATYYADLEGATRLSSDVERLASLLKAYPADAKVSLGDDLAALALEAQVFNASGAPPNASGAPPNASGAPPNASGAPPIQLQLTRGSSLSDRDAGQLRAYLDELQAQLRARSNYDQGRIATMSPEILQLQGQIQQVKNEQDRLALQRDIAKQSYQSLVQEAEGLGIAGHSVDGGTVVASPAIPPTLPVSAHLGTTLAQAGGIGLLLGLSIVGLEEWWRRGSKASALSSGLPSVPGPLLASANGAPEQASPEGSKAI